MKRTITTMLILLIAVGVGSWYLTRGLKATQTMADLPALAPAAPSAPVTIYRWRDENGSNVMSSEPPPPGVAYTTTVADGQLTVVDRPKPVEQPAAESSQGPPLNPLSVYTPEGMSQLVQSAKQAQQASQSHQQMLRDMEQPKN